MMNSMRIKEMKKREEALKLINFFGINEFIAL
jgi:hypothetical protein